MIKDTKTLEGRTAETEPTTFDGRVALVEYEEELRCPDMWNEEERRTSAASLDRAGFYNIADLIRNEINRRKEEKQKKQKQNQKSLWALYQSRVKNFEFGSVATAVCTALAAAPGFVLGYESSTLTT